MEKYYAVLEWTGAAADFAAENHISLEGPVDPEGGFLVETVLPANCSRFRIHIALPQNRPIRCILEESTIDGASIELHCANTYYERENSWLAVYEADPCFLFSADAKQGQLLHLSGKIRNVTAGEVENYWKKQLALQQATMDFMQEEAASDAQELCEQRDDYKAKITELRTTLRSLESAQERQAQDLKAVREHETQLEQAYTAVIQSTAWKASLPLRRLISGVKKVLRTAPVLHVAYTFFACWKNQGYAAAVAYEKRQHLYRLYFPGKAMPAGRFAPVELLNRQVQQPPSGVKISIVVPLYNTPMTFLTEMMDSVRNQTYRNWELCLADASTSSAPGEYARKCAAQDSRIRYQHLAENAGIAGNTNRAIEMATGSYIALLDHDDILHPCALWYAAEKIEKESADFLYTDEVTFEGDIDHLTVFHFKPDFALYNLRANNYICHFTIFRKDLLAVCGGGERGEYNGSQDYDLILRLTEKAEHIVHIPHLMYYWRSSPASVASDISAKPYCIDAAVRALSAHYKRAGVDAQVESIPHTPGFYKTNYVIAGNPKISILIPTMDHIADLTKCINSIYEKSTYSNFEILVIENNSVNKGTFACYKRLQQKHANLRVITWQGTGFNYSALNNFGAVEATGEYLLLLNNDVEVISEHWLEEMLMFAQQEEVGCVGAKLLYSDATIQHAGIGLGLLTLAGHLHRGFAADHPGYMGRLLYAQNVTAVTGACLMVRRSVYEQVHGLDELFAVAFNDVDFCMRVRKAGYQNIFTPFAELYHYESKSRGVDVSDEKRERFVHEVKTFQYRWKEELKQGDPYLNPNFDQSREDFRIAIQPLT